MASAALCLSSIVLLAIVATEGNHHDRSYPAYLLPGVERSYRRQYQPSYRLPVRSPYGRRQRHYRPSSRPKYYYIPRRTVQYRSRRIPQPSNSAWSDAYVLSHERVSRPSRVAAVVATNPDTAAYTLPRDTPALLLPNVQPAKSFSPLLNGHMRIPYRPPVVDMGSMPGAAGMRVASSRAKVCPWNMIPAKSTSSKVLEEALQISQTNVSFVLKNIKESMLRKCRWCTSLGCTPAWQVAIMRITLARADGCDWMDKCECQPIENDWEIECNVEGTILHNTTSVTNFAITCEETNKPEGFDPWAKEGGKHVHHHPDTTTPETTLVTDEEQTELEEEEEEEAPEQGASTEVVTTEVPEVPAEPQDPEKPKDRINGDEEEVGSGSDVGIILIPPIIEIAPPGRGDFNGKEPEPDDAPPPAPLLNDLKQDDLLRF